MQRKYARPWADTQAQISPDARSLVLARNGDWHGSYGLMPCPVCQPERRRDQRALSLTDRPAGGLLATCHKSACSFADVLAGLGLTGSTPAPMPTPAPSRPAPDDAERTRRALALWAEAGPLAGSLGADYLRRRGLDVDPDTLAHALRFHPACAIRGERLPALVALMADPVTGAPCGIQRTPLTPDASKHPIGRAMLGRAGVVMLTPDTDVTDGLGVCEGVETGLAVMALGWRPVWACLSAGMIARLPDLAGIEALTVFADHDAAGLAAAETCAARWADAGCETRIVRPDRAGADFADMIGGAS